MYYKFVQLKFACYSPMLHKIFTEFIGRNYKTLMKEVKDLNKWKGDPLEDYFLRYQFFLTYL